MSLFAMVLLVAYAAGAGLAFPFAMLVASEWGSPATYWLRVLLMSLLWPLYVLLVAAGLLISLFRR